jgi:hypothetical protein
MGIQAALRLLRQKLPEKTRNFLLKISTERPPDTKFSNHWNSTGNGVNGFLGIGVAL